MLTGHKKTETDSDSVDNGVANIARAWFTRMLHERIVLMLSVIFCTGVVTMLWYVSHLQKNLITSTALENAALYTQALQEFRTLYTSEVVSRVRSHGIEVTHDYKTKEGAIPLPATLSMILGENIGKLQKGAQTQLYSPYPFPWREQKGGLRDEFAKEAWDYFTQNPGSSL